MVWFLVYSGITLGYLIRTGDLWLFTLSPLSHDIKDVMVEINIESRGRAHRAQALRLGIYLFIYFRPIATNLLPADWKISPNIIIGNATRKNNGRIINPNGATQRAFCTFQLYPATKVQTINAENREPKKRKARVVMISFMI